MSSKKHNKNLKHFGQREFARLKQVWDEATKSWVKVAK